MRNYLNLKEVELDEHIYRIMPEAYVRAMFANRENVLTRPRMWKDGFENFLRTRDDFEEPSPHAIRNQFVGQCWTWKSLSEAMWGIYAADTKCRFLRIRTTPRRLLDSLIDAHPSHEARCFIGRVFYRREGDLKQFLLDHGKAEMSAETFAKSLLLKRRQFRHEAEVRLLFLSQQHKYDDGLYRYAFDPHRVITQIMADPNRNRRDWLAERAELKTATGFKGEIKRSKIYDPPEWPLPARAAR